ncbi:rhamnogalacturonan lyase [Lunatibacter salilacus]|uniref:rhamnogalacturonan lyase n=1 Tax=Lunatibacter salilacus TaxID=2483804 RepID=UPI0018FEFAC6|nr:rhamnogalacturonan lyase [Lunatibacter salilacus]
MKNWLISTLVLAVSFNTIAQRQMEFLDRGLIAVPSGEDVLVSWRMLGTDPEEISFDVFKVENGVKAVKLNDNRLDGATNLLDTNFKKDADSHYFIQAFVGNELQYESIPVAAWDKPYLSIPLRTPVGYTANDASVGDLTGDGRYEIVVHMTGVGKDNSQKGMTDEPILHAYTLDGDFLWEINLGKNIREGAHYTQFMVYDLDGDGSAEVACKTADGTIDGLGNIIGDKQADWRNEDGYILAGPEFLTVFNGKTGEALATTDFVPPRHPDTENPTEEQLKEVWGDGYGNRVDRFLGGIAYLDGKRPSLIMSRGYYTRTVVAAWNWRDGELNPVWTFDSQDGSAENQKYEGQGYHSLSIADVDRDGKDEIVFGAMVIDNDGSGLYSSGLGHGDAMHVSNIDPDRPGLEIFGIHERPDHPHAANLRDALTGEILWSFPSQDVGRGLSIDIDPRHRGYESWAFGEGLKGVWNAKGKVISENQPSSSNMAVWWDGDLLRELLDGVNIDKWDFENSVSERIFTGEDYNLIKNNGTKSNPCLSADILGDWREELIARTADNKELRIFSTPIPTAYRLYTLMHNPHYRLSIAWQNVAYNQPPHTDFYLGEGMEMPERPGIEVVGPLNK